MLPVMKKVAIDNYNGELVAFAQTVDFAELFDRVRDFAGIDCTFNRPEITTVRGNVHISFMSDDIAKQTGAFACMLKRCFIQSSINGVFRHKGTGELEYWAGVNIRYEHKDGGNNGMEGLRAWYKNGEWAFLGAGERM